MVRTALRTAPGVILAFITLTNAGDAAKRTSDFWAALTADQQRLLVLVIGIALALLGLFWNRLLGNREAMTAQRFQRAFEDLTTRLYKESGGDLSVEGRLHEEAPDFERKQRYEQAGITDLFVPSPKHGRVALIAKANEGDARIGEVRAQGLTQQLRPWVAQWERQSAEVVDTYIGGFRATWFRGSSVDSTPLKDEQLEIMDRKVRKLRAFADDLAKRAAREARL